MLNSSTNPSIGRLGNLLDIISNRQQMTSNNIANVHTPNFKPRHVSFAELLGSSSSANQFETALAKKMGGVGLNTLMSEEGDDGVIVQDELMDMQKNLLFYSLATRRLSSVITALRTAGQVGR